MEVDTSGRSPMVYLEKQFSYCTRKLRKDDLFSFQLMISFKVLHYCIVEFTSLFIRRTMLEYGAMQKKMINIENLDQW